MACVAHQAVLCPVLRDGSALASASRYRVSVLSSPEMSLCINRRKRRSNSSRSLRLLVAHNSSDSTLYVSGSKVSIRQFRPQAVSGDSQAVEGDEGKPASSNEEASSPGTLSPSPFGAGKISSKIASQTSQNGKSSADPSAIKAPAATETVSKDLTSKPASTSPIPSVFQKEPTSKPSISLKTKSLIDDGSDGAFPTGKVSPFAADRLKSQMSSPPSEYNRMSSGRTMINSGKQVLDAFRQGEQGGKTTKFGQPIVPKNIFEDVRLTQAEKDADKFSFSLKPGVGKPL